MHVVLTDLLLPRAVGDVWLRDLPLPGLAALLGHARLVEQERELDSFQRTMPGPRKLAQLFGLNASADRIPMASAWAAGRDGRIVDQRWWIADPVHFALARDHVALADVDTTLDQDESNALAQVAHEAIKAAGGDLDASGPSRWLVAHPTFDGLMAGDPARAIGRNVDRWMPEGDGAKLWRRIHTEIQMQWHEHPVNEQREARGLPPINALWLWGGDRVEPALTRPMSRYTVDATAPTFVRGFARLSVALWGESIAGTAEPLLWIDTLAKPAAREDGAAWQQALLEIDALHCQALVEHRGPLRITLCGESTWRTYEIKRRPRWMFWGRHALIDRLTT